MRSPFSTFRDTSIRNKVTLVTFTACVVALFTLAGGLYAFQLRQLRETFGQEMRTLARIMADNCAVALAFNDQKTAKEVLAPLSVKPAITNAAVLLNDGTEFAAFGKPDDCPPPELYAPAGIVDRGASWTVIEPIVLDGRRIGTFYLDAHLADALHELQQLYANVTATVFGGSLLIVTLLTIKLQSWITLPIQSLAKASNTVARDHDYSLRVECAGRDEVGVLTDSFNQMLAQIQTQDAALQGARNELHDRLQSLQREIAERREAEEALKLSQQKLLEISRLAGMAEVATGVLHNVGNVLNSVNVSGNLLSERLRGSKLGALARVAALIEEHRADFTGFVTNDPRGQRVPDLICRVAAALQAEHASLLAEVEAIGANIGHIKEIVAMQQSFAKVGGLFERMDAEALVRDAFKMCAASLDRHQIAVEWQTNPLPPVLVDKHKALQVLVNLIRNAKQALDEHTGGRKVIAVKIHNNGDDFIQIAITDNGCGIAQENLTRIFAQGFTTRQEGHGIGLHTCANAAREMGGSLSAQSDGPGAGATFILELPIPVTPHASLAA